MAKTKSGIVGYVNTATSITIKYVNDSVYRYDLSKALSKDQLDEMIALAQKGEGLNSYLNKNPEIKKYGYLDDTLKASSFAAY